VKHNAKISTEVSSTVKNKISINKWLTLEFPYFFNTLCAYWPNSILFQGLKNDFTIQYFQYRVGTRHRLFAMKNIVQAQNSLIGQALVFTVALSCLRNHKRTAASGVANPKIFGNQNV